MALELTTAGLETLNDIRETLGIATMKEVYPEAKYYWNSSTGSIGPLSPQSLGTIINFKPLAQCSIVGIPYSNDSKPLSAIQGAEFLINLENRGTEFCLYLTNCSFNTATLNQLFTDLPVTTKTATIHVVGNPGAATCDTSIATNKGYTVVTS